MDNRPWEIMKKTPEAEQLHIEGLEPTPREVFEGATAEMDRISLEVNELTMASDALWYIRVRAVNQMKIEGDYEREQ